MQLSYLSFLIVCWFTLLSTTQAQDPTPVGANLDGIADWSRTLPFVDIVKQSRKFGSVSTPWDGNAPLNVDGYPTDDFGVVLAVGDVHFPGTVFQLRAVCGAQPTFVKDASNPTIEDVTWDPTAKVLTAKVTVGAGDDQLMLGFKGTGGGCTELSVRFAGYPDDAVFTNEWLTLLQKFSIFRYMDWDSTNNNPVVNWADRTTPQHSSWTYGPVGASGIPWEISIQLANTVGRDMWINVPHQANDDYVTQLAQLFKQQLDPKLNLYVEYSNEVWNWGFGQATWNLNAAAAEVQAGDPYKLNYDNCNNKGYWAWRRVASRLKQIMDIFANVWGKDQINKRVRGVLAGQVSFPFVLDNGLAYTEAVWGPPNQFFYAIAGAPYFNLGNTNNNPNMTTDDVINALQASIDAMNPSIGVGENNPLAVHAQFSKWYGLEMRGYEGGPDTFGPNGIQAKANATLDPRMKNLVISYLNTWYSYGFQALNWFVAGADSYDSQYGTWAITDDMSNFDVPKVHGVDTVRTSPTPALAIGNLLPTTINATYWVGHPVPLVDPYVRYINQNETFFYLVRTNSAGSYKVSVSTAGTSSESLGISLNNKPQVVVNTPNTGNWDTFQPTTPVTLNFDSGLNVVRLFALANRGYNIQALIFS